MTAARLSDVDHATPWLSLDEQRDWRAVLTMCISLLEGLDADLHGDGLSLADYEVLVHLSADGGQQLRMSELAQRVLVSKSRLTYRVDRLESEGLVRREKCGTDRRGSWAVLTEKGWDRLRSVAPHHVESVRRRLVDTMSAEDFETLGRLAATVVEAAGPHAALHAAESACPDLTGDV
jgi:DNA-binding MarR family transcriptional regulator